MSKLRMAKTLELVEPPIPESLQKILAGFPKRDREMLLRPNPRAPGMAIGLSDFAEPEEGQYNCEFWQTAHIIHQQEKRWPLKVKGIYVGAKAFGLDEFQAVAVSKLYPCGRAILVAPTGAGKTVMGIALAAILGKRTLFVTHRLQIAEQTRELAMKMLGEEDPTAIGFVGGGKREIGTYMTIAVAQSIIRKPLDDLYGTLIIDEAHHMTAKTLATVIHDYSAERRYGMTATLSRSDKRDALFPYLLGKEIVEVTLDEAKERVVIPSVRSVYTHMDGAARSFCEHKCKIFANCSLFPKKVLDCEFFTSKMYVYLTGWANQPERNELILEQVVRLDSEGVNRILVLVGHRNHALILKHILEGLGVESWMAYGAQSFALNKYNMDMFRVCGGVLVGTESYLGEGTDLPEVDALVLACPAGGKTKVMQRVGRIMRGEGEKQVVDFVDADPYSKRLWWARKRVYKRMGMEISEA